MPSGFNDYEIWTVGAMQPYQRAAPPTTQEQRERDPAYRRCMEQLRRDSPNYRDFCDARPIMPREQTTGEVCPEVPVGNCDCPACRAARQREYSPTRCIPHQPYADTAPEVWLCIAKPDTATAKMIFRGDPKCKVIRCQDGTEVLRRNVMKRKRKKLAFDVESVPVPQERCPLPGATPEFMDALKAKLSCYVEPERFKPELDVLYAWFECDNDSSVLTPSLTAVAIKINKFPGCSYGSAHCNAYARLNETLRLVDGMRSPEDCAEFMEAYFRDDREPTMVPAGNYVSWSEPSDPIHWVEMRPAHVYFDEAVDMASTSVAQSSNDGIYAQLQACVQTPPTRAPLDIQAFMETAYQINRDRRATERAERLAPDNAQTDASQEDRRV